MLGVGTDSPLALVLCQVPGQALHTQAFVSLSRNPSGICDSHSAGERTEAQRD